MLVTKSAWFSDGKHPLPKHKTPFVKTYQRYKREEGKDAHRLFPDRIDSYEKNHCSSDT